MEQTSLSLMLAALFALPVQASDEQISTAAEQSQLSLTVYNDNLALVRDQRQVPLKAGVNHLAWKDVAAQIQAQSALLSSDSAPIHVLEQNFDYDLLNERALLDKYIGQDLTIITTHPQTGEEKRETATVLAFNDNLILKYADRIESALPYNARIAYPSVPSNLRDRPTLTMALNTEQAAQHQLNLSYLTTGFDWHADYVATLSPDEKHLDIASWVTVNNNSGVAYENAQLQLIAGEINRAPQYQPEQMMMKAARVSPAPAMEVPFVEENLFEYHLYTLERPTTLKNNQQKQIALLSANQVPIQKTYRMTGRDYRYYHNNEEAGEPRDVEVFVQFDNKEPLGKALPAGVVRVYQEDSQKRQQLIGEDRIQHTPKNETVRLKLGKAFDVKANWNLLEHKRLNNSLLSYEQHQVKVQIELRNQKDEDVVVQVLEPMGSEWSIESESHKHEKSSAHYARWDISVPAQGKALLEYTAKLKY